MAAESSAAVAPSADPVVLRALAGDRDAEREVCRRLEPAVRSFAMRRLTKALADDLVQDALILLVEALREGRVLEPSRVASFALGIFHNLARERARVRDRRRELLERYGLGDADFIVDGPSPDVRREQLEDCYSQLTERARRVVRATFANEDTDAEIATALSIGESNVRVIRHRSLAALRTCLEKPISWVQQ
jgi:RNA polymerase sigma-70 factor (ECF subfamily)